MITLSGEAGLVRIESWDDIESRAGFARDIDPKTVKLKAIIGAYTFSTYLPCGLSTCRQPHGHGYLVTTIDGRETNIGKDCGRKHFLVEFEQMRRTFVRDVAAQQRREFLWSMKHRLPYIEAELAELRQGVGGAVWINARVNHLSGKSSGLPSPVVSAVRRAQVGGGALVLERMRKAEERATSMAAQEVIGLNRRGGGQMRGGGELFVQETVGQLEGFAALTPEFSLRSILTDGLDPILARLRNASIDDLTARELATLNRAATEIDGLMDKLRAALAHGRRLLKRNNIGQLVQFATTTAERRLLSSFMNDLPAE